MEKEGKIIIDNLENDLITEEILNEGMDLLKHGKINHALEYFNEIIKSKTKNADIWFSLGEAYEKCEEFETAIKCFDEAIRLRKV